VSTFKFLLQTKQVSGFAGAVGVHFSIQSSGFRLGGTDEFFITLLYYRLWTQCSVIIIAVLSDFCAESCDVFG
jgi:hypothetical protein